MSRKSRFLSEDEGSVVRVPSMPSKGVGAEGSIYPPPAVPQGQPQLSPQHRSYDTCHKGYYYLKPGVQQCLEKSALTLSKRALAMRIDQLP